MNCHKFEKVQKLKCVRYNTHMERSRVEETVTQTNQEVLLKGWVNTRRDHGKLTFIDLRDKSGLVQLVFNPQVSADAHQTASQLSNEDVVEVEGLVKARPEKLVNPDLLTGTVEIEATRLTILSKAETPPFPLDTDGHEIDEELRMRYRYLDLRRPRMLQNLIVRDKTISFIRNFLHQRQFTEVETPILTKSTPEGARDFVVPSRLQQGKFYALPQSPQQYKQLLMVAGIERYFQIARCFRDEDPRADRAYGEFTQLDIEMSFITQEDILRMIEELFTTLAKEVWPNKHITQTPWPRISHHEAVQEYQSDKPDLRKDTADKNELAFAWIVDFPLFAKQSADDFFHGSGKAQFAPSHHMFTAPHPDDIELLDTDPLQVRGLQHDMVLNGFEVGGGSIRIHQPRIQEKIFELIGFTNEQKQEFAHMLDAFRYGVPPHGGIAPGIDRFLMAALGEPSLRETIAFPATSGGKTAVMDAPSAISHDRLKELGIQITESPASK